MPRFETFFLGVFVYLTLAAIVPLLICFLPFLLVRLPLLVGILLGLQGSQLQGGR